MSSNHSNELHAQRKALRVEFRKRRLQLSDGTQRVHANRIYAHFFASDLATLQDPVAGYLAANGEPNIQALLLQLAASGQPVGLPVVDGKTMAFYRYSHDTTLRRNRFGIMEPTRDGTPIDPLAFRLVLLPLVAFDDAGHRLGMGGGYYDRYLANIPIQQRPQLVGVAHECQYSQTTLPDAEWDIALTGIITEAGYRRLPVGATFD